MDMQRLHRIAQTICGRGKHASRDAPNVSGGGGGTAFDAERICANTVMPVPAMPVCAAAASSASRGSTPPDETRMRSCRVSH